jgi:hypothetical protein
MSGLLNYRLSRLQKYDWLHADLFRAGLDFMLAPLKSTIV